MWIVYAVEPSFEERMICVVDKDSALDGILQRSHRQSHGKVPTAGC